MRISVPFSLDPEEDRDLAQWLSSLPRTRRSAAIRDALRRARSSEVTLADVYQVAKSIERRLQGMALAANSPAAAAIEEPPEAAAALDELGL